MNLPRISVNIPLRTNGDASVVLESLRSVNYPKNLFEIIIIEGNHLTKQRNVGVEQSKGKIIYLLDDDSQVQSYSFKVLAQEFSNSKVAAVGGPSLTPEKEKNYISRLVGYILETYFGAFRMRSKWSRQAMNYKINDYHFIGSNLALRKASVLNVGGFDERFDANDETELLRRLQHKGYTLKYNTNLFIYRSQRKDFYQLAKQFHHYGKGRMMHILKNPKREDFFLLAPIGFGMYFITLIFFHPLWYFFPLGLYSILGIATAAKVSIKYRDFSLLVAMPLVFPIIHISYAMGMVHELSLSKKRVKKKQVRIKVYHIKQFSAKNFSLYSS